MSAIKTLKQRKAPLQPPIKFGSCVSPFEGYAEFISSEGFGYYSGGALHFFCPDSSLEYNDGVRRSHELNTLYSGILQEQVTAIGEDLFGNHFVFYSEGIGLVEVETGSITFIARNFNDFLDTLLGDYDFFTGESLARSWLESGNKLAFYERLIPKIPFVAGGQYELANLHNMDYYQALRFYSDFARQIFDLPEGTKIQFKIVE